MLWKEGLKTHANVKILNALFVCLICTSDDVVWRKACYLDSFGGQNEEFMMLGFHTKVQCVCVCVFPWL